MISAAPGRAATRRTACGDARGFGTGALAYAGGNDQERRLLGGIFALFAEVKSRPIGLSVPTSWSHGAVALSFGVHLIGAGRAIGLPELPCDRRRRPSKPAGQQAGQCCRCRGTADPAPGTERAMVFILCGRTAASGRPNPDGSS